MNKLVRGKIVDILKADGVDVSWRRLDDDSDYHHALLEKLLEEVRELLENPCMEEIADVAEVLYALVPLHGGWGDYTTAITSKRETKGDFSGRIFVDEIEF